jgi:hypothetical protein
MRSKFVLLLRAVTFADGTTAPLESVISPVKLALLICAATGKLASKRDIRAISRVFI